MTAWNKRFGSLLGAMLLAAPLGCNDAGTATLASDGTTVKAVQSLTEPAQLAKVRAALPKVAFPHLQDILTSPQTIWYDHDVMPSVYQDSMGAQVNSTWPDLVAVSDVSMLYDRAKKRWQFPLATTAGTDNSTNLRVENFIALPQRDGALAAIPIWSVPRNYNRQEWNWAYPVNTTLGEVLFVVDGGNLLPVEIRIRTRYATGWATNVFRPFPTAKSLAAAVKSRRADWSNQVNLRALVASLEDNTTLTPKTLAAKAALAPTFHQNGYLDNLPDFGDAALVRELLTSTTFSSAYNTAWKENGAQKSYAANSSAALSIVPNNYDAGLIPVTEDSCMRCHKEGGRLVSEFNDALYLYGEVWGKDAIFSFYPYDQARFPELRSNDDNRSIDPKLKAMGVFEAYDASKHVAPYYPAINANEPIITTK